MPGKAAKKPAKGRAKATATTKPAKKPSYIDEWMETRRLYRGTPPVEGTYPKERLQAAKPGWSGPFRRDWVGKFPIALSQRDAGIKRDVDFSVSSWQGQSLGAVHWYGEAHQRRQDLFLPKEHDEPYPPGSAPKEDRWISCEVPDGCNNGLDTKANVMHRIDAERFILAMMRYAFPPETHNHFSGYAESAHRVFRETTVNDPIVVLPATPHTNLQTMRRKGEKLTCPLSVGDPVRFVESTPSYDWFMAEFHAEKCNPDDADCIGTVTEILLSESEERRDDYWVQYFVAVKTELNK